MINELKYYIQEITSLVGKRKLSKYLQVEIDNYLHKNLVKSFNTTLANELLNEDYATVIIKVEIKNYKLLKQVIKELTEKSDNWYSIELYSVLPNNKLQLRLRKWHYKNETNKN